jgi:hypothetical protein
MLILIAFNGCYYDEVVIVNEGPPRASVTYDFWAGARNVEIDGELFNDGNVFINEAEIEVLLFDIYGEFISSYFYTFHVDLRSRDFTPFEIDISQRGVFDVDVRIVDLY